MPRRRDQRVFRAEFRDRIITTSGQERIVKGHFVVEVAKAPDTRAFWVASIDSSPCMVLCYGPTAAKAKRRARGYFGAALTDWVVGEHFNGQWRPVDEARERELKGVA